jgi:splicing factor 3B subunit 1
LVGRIADRGPEYVSAREWMRICFELLELLKAHKKAIRRATVNTFGYIAKAIGETEIVMVIMYTIIFFFFSTTNFRPTRCIGYTA